MTPDMQLHYRTIQIMAGSAGGPMTFNRERRSVRITGMTEAPVPMWYKEYGGVVPEVVLVRGMQFPANGKVPLIDTHDRSTVQSVLGSFMPEMMADTVDGDVVFSSVQDAEDAMIKVMEGHITDFSGGYGVHSHQFVPEGKSAKIAGRTWQGPVVVVTSSTLREMTICPIGADENAKARALGVHLSVNENNRKEQDMNLEEVAKSIEATNQAVAKLARSKRLEA